jgi:hypothetical protein
MIRKYNYFQVVVVVHIYKRYEGTFILYVYCTRTLTYFYYDIILYDKLL